VSEIYDLADITTHVRAAIKRSGIKRKPIVAIRNDSRITGGLQFRDLHCVRVNPKLFVSADVMPSLRTCFFRPTITEERNEDSATSRGYVLVGGPGWWRYVDHLAMHLDLDGNREAS
jgi:hypothetical protein